MRTAIITMFLLIIPGTLVAAERCEQAKVVKVIDGDTIKVACDGEKITVRLIGIDTPETHRPNTPVQCYGKEATSYLQSRIGNKEVRLEYGDERTDKYGRTLAYVFLGREFINAEMIEKGYAFVYRRFPFIYRKDFLRHEKAAKDQGLGLWNACKITCSGPICHTEGE